MRKLRDKISLKEIARDVIAFGSPVFFIIVIARISLLSNFQYLSQFLISGFLFMVLFFLFRSNVYSGLGLIVLVFTTIYYNSIKFTVFGVVIYLLLLLSLVYLGKGKREVLVGVVLGAVSALVSYIVAGMAFN